MNVALLSAIDQLALLHERKISVAELCEEHIRRIERINPKLNAFVDFDPDRVRAQARLKDSSPASSKGALAGLPLSIKSSIEVAGHRCEIGSTLRRGITAAADATAVARLRNQGAIILGTTNCPEFLMAYETNNLLHGRTNNPWNLDHSAGGSSGGESAAIAAGLSAGGLGSDSGGSVREPAHFTGICSLKPTPGRVPSAGHVPPCVGPFSSLGAVGPMARTIADLALFFQVICTGNDSDQMMPPVPVRPVSLADARRVTIGWLDDDGVLPAAPETRATVRVAAEELEKQGFYIQHLRPGSPQSGDLFEILRDAHKLWRVFFVQCGALFFESTIAGQRERLSSVFTNFLDEAALDPPLTAASLLQAWADADILRSRMFLQQRERPILLTPVCAVPAFRHGERSWKIDGREVDYWNAMRYTQWFNLLASPAAVVPIGMSPEGLPIGVQIAGRPYDDELVLSIANVLHQSFGYSSPPCSVSMS